MGLLKAKISLSVMDEKSISYALKMGETCSIFSDFSSPLNAGVKSSYKLRQDDLAHVLTFFVTMHELALGVFSSLHAYEG